MMADPPGYESPLLKFVALGGIWLDEICTPGKATVFDVPGGSVAFVTFGALLFSLDEPNSIGLIVKAGHDFPESLERTFTEWNLDLHIIRDNDIPSPRGRILYGVNASKRTYQRLTSPFPSTVPDLAATNMIPAACFHFFDVPATVATQIDNITTLRTQQGISRKPLYVWEPQAKSCSSETFKHHKAVVEKVDIFSPNHAELASFFAPATSGEVTFDMGTVEKQAGAFMPSSPSHPVCVLIRCAEHGCYVRFSSSGAEHDTWLPAYHVPDSSSVVDTTGAGNAFLGGAAMGYLQHEDFVVAAAYGSVAASFAVETVGLPMIEECDANARLSSFLKRPS